MKLVARFILGLILLAVILLMVCGLVEVANERGLGVALAIFPGVPFAVAVLLILAYTAFPD